MQTTEEIYYGYEVEAMSGSTVKSTQFDSMPGTDWAKHFYPNLFSRSFTSYQNDFWEWGDSIELNKYYRPRVECEPRGVGKSTNAEGLVVKLVATKKATNDWLCFT